MVVNECINESLTLFRITFQTKVCLINQKQNVKNYLECFFYFL